MILLNYINNLNKMISDIKIIIIVYIDIIYQNTNNITLIILK